MRECIRHVEHACSAGEEEGSKKNRSKTHRQARKKNTRGHRTKKKKPHRDELYLSKNQARMERGKLADDGARKRSLGKVNVSSGARAKDPAPEAEWVHARPHAQACNHAKIRPAQGRRSPAPHDSREDGAQTPHTARKGTMRNVAHTHQCRPAAPRASQRRAERWCADRNHCRHLETWKGVGVTPLVEGSLRHSFIRESVNGCMRAAVWRHSFASGTYRDRRKWCAESVQRWFNVQRRLGGMDARDPL